MSALGECANPLLIATILIKSPPRFPYVDTLKVLEKWGPGCFFYPDGSDQYIDELDALLAKRKAVNPSEPPILALFTELPSNPLLLSFNLPRLRELADKYGFPIVIDDTIGNFANVNTLLYADVVASSLSKLFSGRADVMGGRSVSMLIHGIFIIWLMGFSV